MNAPLDPIPPLSPIGMTRRDAILRAAQQHARSRRTRRRVVRSSAAVCLITLIMGGIALLIRPHASAPAPAPAVALNPEPTPDRVPNPTPREHQENAPQAVAFDSFSFEAIQTNPTIEQRYALVERPDSVAQMSDDQLLRSLHDAGVDAGLATIGGRSVVILNDRFTTQR